MSFVMQEVSQVMQGVEVFIALIPNYFHYFNFMSRDFYHCLLSEVRNALVYLQEFIGTYTMHVFAYYN